MFWHWNQAPMKLQSSTIRMKNQIGNTPGGNKEDFDVQRGVLERGKDCEILEKRVNSKMMTGNTKLKSY